MKLNWKHILWSAVGIAIVGGAAYFIFRSKDEQPPTTLPTVEPNSEYGKRLEAFRKDTPRKQRMVDELLVAMKGLGTKFSKIKEILQEIEDENFMRSLIGYFHKKTYRKVVVKPPFYEEVELDLIGWFKEELSESEYKELKDMYPNSL
ncbi:hypothetical protein [Capnocytophaga canis]|uniref:Uncharacterized protein n=1 Tax=Capnocytophaga canis TaxID=1848903 RepID=A0A0B7IVD4_9FLAO|nr:hypothetical protein [Capnocytophaga canis]CEN54062.1 conserved hypothetical protein [Capnocytophaga canis]